MVRVPDISGSDKPDLPEITVRREHMLHKNRGRTILARRNTARKLEHIRMHKIFCHPTHLNT